MSELKSEFCTVCNKKLPLTAYACKCGNKYCKSHLFPELHACGFDYFAENKQKLKESIIPVTNQKITKI